MNHFELHRSNYLLELQRKHELETSIGLPVGIVTIVGGAIFVFLRDLKGFQYDSVFLWLALFIFVSIGFLILGVLFLIRSYYYYDYAYLPTSSELKKYYDDLANYYNGENEKAESEFLEYAIGEYAANAHINSLSNNTKTAYMHKAKGFIIGAMVSLLVASPFYMIKYYAFRGCAKN